MQGDGISPEGAYVDPVYGQIPVTAYVGIGAGYGYGGVGGGLSHTLYHEDATQILPWQ
jgi:hypothetical protein